MTPRQPPAYCPSCKIEVSQHYTEISQCPACHTAIKQPASPAREFYITMFKNVSGQPLPLHASYKFPEEKCNEVVHVIEKSAYLYAVDQWDYWVEEARKAQTERETFRRNFEIQCTTLSSAEAAREVAEQQYDAANHECQSLIGDLTLAEKDCAELRAKLQAVTAERNEYLVKIGSLQREFDYQYAKRREVYCTTATEHDVRCEELTARAEKAEAGIEQANQVVADLRKVYDLEKVTAHIARLERELSEYKALNQANYESFIQANRLLREKEKELAAARAELADRATKGRAQKIAELEAERDAALAEVERLSSSPLERDKQWQKKVETLETECERLKHKFDGQYSHDSKALDTVHRDRDRWRDIATKLAISSGGKDLTEALAAFEALRKEQA